MTENEIFVGKKPLMSYVFAVITQFSEGGKGVVIKARGKTISKAVDIAQIVKNRFAKDAEVGPIKIGTEELEAKEGGKINVSTIEIPIKKWFSIFLFFMIQEKLLVKLSLITIIIGLASLYFVSVFAEIKFIELGKICKEDVGKVVRTKGTISKSFLAKDSHTLFLDLEENGKKLLVVMFGVDENQFSKGEEVSVKGEISLYKGRLEIIAKEIKKIQ